MRIEKSWGYEEVIHNGDYCCKLLVYTKPIASSLHYHEKKHETFTILRGLFEIEVGVVKHSFGPGDYVVIPPTTPHRVRYTPLWWKDDPTVNYSGIIIESSTHDDPSDCVRLIPSE